MALLSDGVRFNHGPAMPNRFMLAPLTNQQSHADGSLSDDEYRWLTMRAEGGFGLTMTCAAHVQKSGNAFSGQLGIWSDDHLPGLSRLAAAINATGSLSSVQLHHGGERSSGELSGEDVVAPFANPKFNSRALTTGEVEQLIADFAAAAARAEKAGFHGVELHGAHGYMLCSFLNARMNQRDDRYGGSYENRTRVIRETIAAVRATTGPDFQLGLRLSPERFGVEMEEALRLAQEVMTEGSLDYLDMSLWDCLMEPVDPGFKGKPLVDWFAALDRGSCKLGVAGKIMSGETARTLLGHGVDFVLIGKGAMVHHDFARQALAAEAFEAQPFPLSRDHYRREGLGESFISYVAQTWPDYVAD